MEKMIDYKMNNEVGNWIKNYPINQYGEDYKLCVDLTYKYGVKNESVCRKWIGGLKNYLNKNGVDVDGFVVNEFDSNVINLHNHLLLWVNSSYSKSKNLIYNYWNKLGSVHIMKYDSNLNYSGYMCKFLGRNDSNYFDLITNY